MLETNRVIASITQQHLSDAELRAVLVPGPGPIPISRVSRPGKKAAAGPVRRRRDRGGR